MKFVPKELRKTANVSRGDTSWGSFLKNTASVLVTLILAYVALGLLANLVATTIPSHWEANLFAEQVDDTTPTPPLDRADFILRGLLEGSALRPLPYRLSLLDLHHPNAFALPGGGITITRGLLKKVENDTALATVIAHELGHHHHRHSLKRMGRSLVYQTAMAVLFGGGQRSLVDAALRTAEAGYSRRQETQADEFALRLVHQVYGHTDGSLELYLIMGENEAVNAPQWATFLRSHPLTEPRIERLRTLQDELRRGAAK